MLIIALEIVITCALIAHWAELIRPQRWAGVRACPPWRQGKVLLLVWYWWSTMVLN